MKRHGDDREDRSVVESRHEDAITGADRVRAVGSNAGDADGAGPARPKTREARLAVIRGEDLLIELGASAEMRRPDSPLYTDERMIAWLDHEVNAPHRSGEGWSAEKIKASAARLRAKAEAIRLSVRPVAGSPPVEAAAIVGTIPQVLDEARAMRAAPRLDLSAAAGVGRDLWDEPCDQWVEIPEDMPDGRYIAVPISGESMTPLIHTGDTVLVEVGVKIVRDTVVLARLSDGGYAVKRVGRLLRGRLELLSLNSEFPPVVVPRDERTVIGTVVLRWCPHTASDGATVNALAG